LFVDDGKRAGSRVPARRKPPGSDQEKIAHEQRALHAPASTAGDVDLERADEEEEAVRTWRHELCTTAMNILVSEAAAVKHGGAARRRCLHTKGTPDPVAV
jgi:hypothetical protein